jgi:hypothetical protein
MQMPSATILNRRDRSARKQRIAFPIISAYDTEMMGSADSIELRNPLRLPHESGYESVWDCRAVAACSLQYFARIAGFEWQAIGMFFRGWR